MDSIEELSIFLTSGFLTRRNRPKLPDGRMLYLYECNDVEFWCLVDLLRKCGSPIGYDFNRYRERWQAFRQEIQDRTMSSPKRASLWSAFTRDLDWTIRGFVLYASEFWRRFKNDEWRERHFPDKLPFEKLKWAHFLSMVGWGDLYKGKDVRFVKVDAPNRSELGHRYEIHEGDNPYPTADESERVARYGETGSGGYPGLYFPMLAAWEWWRVAPLRLPTSIRYLDTFAQQGGASDRLVIAYEFAFEQDGKSVYRATNPENGYGMGLITLQSESHPSEADLQSLEVTVEFGAKAKV